jgi:hypothetical protein
MSNITNSHDTTRNAGNTPKSEKDLKTVFEILAVASISTNFRHIIKNVWVVFICIIAAIICHNDELSSILTWLDCLHIDLEGFTLFPENNQILLKIYFILLLSTFMNISSSTLSQNWVVNNLKSSQFVLLNLYGRQAVRCKLNLLLKMHF